MLLLLRYSYVPDIAERRTEFRPAHIAHVQQYADRGEIVLAGALDEPLDGAAIVFEAATAATVEAFVSDDPYVRAGLVVGWWIRRWNLVAGAGRLTP